MADSTWGSPLAARGFASRLRLTPRKSETARRSLSFFQQAISTMRSMLVIDRSEILTKVFGEVFKKRGWEVESCNDRDSAIRRLSGSKRYDAVLLSYRVPGTNGMELVGFIRALEHRR